jgi:2-polyprenyl-6-methoxyphenol hydroxylase-like FAD-dependent oxidoreductase
MSEPSRRPHVPSGVSGGAPRSPREPESARAGEAGVTPGAPVAVRSVARVPASLPSSSLRHRQVIVVGAGPTGLLLAGDLAAAGVDTLLLERRGDASNLTRAFAVHARTLELLDARGLADDLVAAGQPVPGLRLFGQVQVDLSRLPSRYPFVLVLPQYLLEERLAERALASGVEFLAGQEVVDLRQTADVVTVVTRDADGRRHEFTADHVVGCDGAHSAVREALGLPFPGHSAVRSVMLGDVRLTEAPPEVLTVDAGPDGFAFLAPFGDGWYRVIAWDRRDQQDDDVPVDFDSLRDITRRVLGRDYGMSDPRWTSRFHSDERQVSDYRVGRVLLAGDAAHIHSPAGGQGMNTGLQDAANLSWRLALVAAGRLSVDVLDSYQRERHPVGQRALRASGGLLHLVMVSNPMSRWARDHLGIAVARFRPTATRIAGRISGLDVRYRTPGYAHSRVGERVGDCTVTTQDGTQQRLYETLRAGRFVVVLPPEDSHLASRVASDDSVAVLGGGATGEWLLVRPDGHVAAVITGADPDDRAQALRNELRRWCGAVPDPTGVVGEHRS